jgi:RimK family alpha-L-glutamate ligase
VLARLDVRRSLDGVEPGFEQLDRLLERGVRLVNPPSSLLAAHDKLQTAIRLAEAGVPHPRTAHVDDQSPAPDLEFPVVVKPRFGSWGRDVVLCEDARDLRRALSKLKRRQWFRKQGALVQELVPPRGYDLRVVVSSGTVVGGIKRVAATGEWRTNVALGGTRVPTRIPAHAGRMAIRAAEALGCDLVGIDLLPRRGGYVVLEVNACVDFNETYSFDGRDVFADALRPFAADQVAVGAAAERALSLV